MFRRMTMAAAAVLVVAAGPAVAQVTDAPPPAAAPAADPASLDAPPAADPALPVRVSPVPEPGTILLVAIPAAIGWVVYWCRRWRTRPAAQA